MSLTQFQVTIANSSLGAAVGSATGLDGFFDPTTVGQYMTNTLQTASANLGTIVVGQVVMINNYPVTVLTGTSVSNLVTDINNLTYKHHAIAAANGSKLTLINEPLHYNKTVSVSDGTAGITAQLGFAAPVISVVAPPSLFTQSLAKARGNWRWKQLLNRLMQTGTIVEINSVIVTGIDLTFATNTTQIEFNVVYDSTMVYGYDLSNNLVYGTQALVYACTNAILDSGSYVDVVYNPGVPTDVGNPPPYNNTSVQLTVGPLTASSVTAQGNVTVTNVVE